MQVISRFPSSGVEYILKIKLLEICLVSFDIEDFYLSINSISSEV